MSELNIRQATREDIGSILFFVRKLAEYEKLLDEVEATEATLEETLFGDKAVAYVIIAEYQGEAAGFALYFYNYSTFLAKPGIYLEDLFVLPEYRGKKIGKALLVSLARLAVEQNCGRFEWAVLDWNQPAIDFYRAMGAVGMEGWTTQRVSGAALDKLANLSVE